MIGARPRTYLVKGHFRVWAEINSVYQPEQMSWANSEVPQCRSHIVYEWLKRKCTNQKAVIEDLETFHPSKICEQFGLGEAVTRLQRPVAGASLIWKIKCGVSDSAGRRTSAAAAAAPRAPGSRSARGPGSPRRTWEAETGARGWWPHRQWPLCKVGATVCTESKMPNQTRFWQSCLPSRWPLLVELPWTGSF